MSPFYLKKWYFDLISPEGDSLYFYFITARIAGLPQGLASAHLLLADGQEIRAIDKTPFAAPDAEGSLRLGRHAFSFRSGRVEVRMEFSNVALDLAYAPRLGPWWPTEGGVLLRQKGRIPKDLRWHVPLPSARVEGVITVDARKKSVAGDGYLDVVETNIPPWRLPLAELQWGRAHFADQTVVFNQIRTRQGEFIQNLFLAETLPNSGSRRHPSPDDQSFTLQADSHDTQTALNRAGAFGLLLVRRKVIEESPVVSAERFRMKSARGLLRRLTGDPREKKMVSQARLELDGKTMSGTALHERVSWHWPEEVQP
jgi:hypothetical protein